MSSDNSAITRYDMEWVEGTLEPTVSMEPAKQGQWVRFEDYAALAADAKRLDWLEAKANEAIEVESFIGGKPETDAVFLEWAWDDVPSTVPKRIAVGRTLREALDIAAKKYPLKPAAPEVR